MNPMFGMTTVISAAGAILLGAIGWFTLEFVGRPIRQFFDLRREIHQQMMFLANVAIPGENDDDELSGSSSLVPEGSRSGTPI